MEGVDNGQCHDVDNGLDRDSLFREVRALLEKKKDKHAFPADYFHQPYSLAPKASRKSEQLENRLDRRYEAGLRKLPVKKQTNKKRLDRKWYFSIIYYTPHKKRLVVESMRVNRTLKLLKQRLFQKCNKVMLGKVYL